MGQEKILTIVGSPGCGKTTTAVKLARTLAARKKNVIVVFCEPFTPVIPALVPSGTEQERSLGFLLTAPGITQADILNGCVLAPGSSYISLLGYRQGESLMNYPKVTRDKALELLVSLRYLADYVIIDCATVIEADPTSFVAIEVADWVLKMGTANLKGISWFQTHARMLEEREYGKEKYRMAIGNLKVGQDWEIVSGQYGGVDYMLPYTAELEQQDNEMALFEPLFSPESGVYQTEINHILLDVFGFRVTDSSKAEKKAAKQGKISMPGQEPTRTKGSFKLSFTKNRGEF